MTEWSKSKRLGTCLVIILGLALGCVSMLYPDDPQAHAVGVIGVLIAAAVVYWPRS